MSESWGTYRCMKFLEAHSTVSARSAYLLAVQDLESLKFRESVVSEFSLEAPAENTEFLIRALRNAAEAFVREFGDRLVRINRHTDLCLATTKLRDSARRNRNSPFYWAIVEIDDCTRAAVPEDMTPQMAQALFACVEQLAPALSEEQMLGMTEDLYDAELRPWREKRRAARKRSAR